MPQSVNAHEKQKKNILLVKKVINLLINSHAKKQIKQLRQQKKIKKEAKHKDKKSIKKPL